MDVNKSGKLLHDPSFEQLRLPTDEIIIFTDETLPGFHRAAMRAVVITDQALYLFGERKEWQRFPFVAIVNVALISGEYHEATIAKFWFGGLCFVFLLTAGIYTVGAAGLYASLFYTLLSGAVLGVLIRQVINTRQGTTALRVVTTTETYTWQMPALETTEADKFDDWRMVRRTLAKLAEIGVTVIDKIAAAKPSRPLWGNSPPPGFQIKQTAQGEPLLHYREARGCQLIVALIFLFVFGGSVISPWTEGDFCLYPFFVLFVIFLLIQIYKLLFYRRFYRLQPEQLIIDDVHLFGLVQRSTIIPKIDINAVRAVHIAGDDETSDTWEVRLAWQKQQTLLLSHDGDDGAPIVWFAETIAAWAGL